jgi:hypothetical protein
MATATLASMTEAELMSNVIELAHVFGWRVAHFRPAMTSKGWRTPVSADGAGFPDLAMTRDRVIYAELKSARGVTSDSQKNWLAALSNAGAEEYVWRPIDWLDGSIEAVLRSRT